jgi:integrase/recombinase XerC
VYFYIAELTLMADMVSQLIDQFERYLRFEKRVSDRTLIAYKGDLDQFSTYLTELYEIVDIADVKPIHIRSWLVSLREKDAHKERSMQRKISALKSWYKFLLKRQHVAVDPLLQIKAPKAPKRIPVFLEQEQSEKLFDETEFEDSFKGRTDQLIMELLYQTGIRRAELIGLQEADIDLYRKQIVVMGKRSKERAIPIGAQLADLIRKYMQEKKERASVENKFLLTLDSGKPLYDNYVYRRVKEYIGSDITTLSKRSPHVMRHTFATQLMNNGAGISAIKELLGHSSLAATQVYTHSNIEHLKKIYQKAHPKASKDD